MTDLVNTAQLGEHFNRSAKSVAAALTRLGVRGMSVRYGKGKMELFDRASTIAVLEPEFRKPVAAPAPSAPGPDLRLLLEAVGDVDAKTDNLVTALAKLVEQNVLLFRALNDLRADALSKIDSLQSTVDQAIERVTAWVPTPAAPRSALPEVTVLPLVAQPAKQDQPDKPKPRVAIVGLPKSHQTAIEREFTTVFELRFFAGDKANADALSNCVKVLLMASFSNDGISHTVKAAGPRLVRILGGVSSLRNRLTDLFVELSDKEKVHG